MKSVSNFWPVKSIGLGPSNCMNNIYVCVTYVNAQCTNPHNATENQLNLTPSKFLPSFEKRLVPSSQPWFHLALEALEVLQVPAPVKQKQLDKKNIQKGTVQHI